MKYVMVVILLLFAAPVYAENFIELDCISALKKGGANKIVVNIDTISSLSKTKRMVVINLSDGHALRCQVEEGSRIYEVLKRLLTKNDDSAFLQLMLLESSIWRSLPKEKQDKILNKYNGGFR